MGREPTSANCHTCRLRRVRCDKRKPCCTRCLKAGYECQGYEKILRVQSHGVVRGNKPGSSHLVRLSKTDSYPSPSILNDGHPNTASPGGQSSSDRGSNIPSVSAAGALSHQIHQPSYLSLEAFIDNITFSYFFDAYSWINIHSILLQDTPMRQHLAQEDDELCYESLRALAYGLFSRDHQIEKLRRTAASIYGRNLRTLQSRLAADVSKTNVAFLIKPIAVMGSYSIAVDGDLRFTHHDGLAQVLKYCGPESFQDPAILPMFESCRFTMIANAIVRRQGTFLEQEIWRTIPWISTKTNTSKLIDILAEIPGIIQGADDVLDERAMWVVGGYDIVRNETPMTVQNLRQSLENVSMKLESWRANWTTDNTSTGSDLIEWVLSRTGDDLYRPGIYEAQGPDVYGLNMGNITGLVHSENPSLSTYNEPDATPATFALMHEAALYITALIWVDRLRKNLDGAARAPNSVDFYNAPFFTQCHCYFDNPGPSRLCQIFPEPSDRIHSKLSWNTNSARVCESPIRSIGNHNVSDNTKINPDEVFGTEPSGPDPSDSFLPSTSQPLANSGKLLLPGDGRFSGQLRILNWLVKHLPLSRPYVLGTLAAMGLSHCVHDVRPSEGNEYIAESIRETMARSKFEGAAELLLRSYR